MSLSSTLSGVANTVLCGTSSVTAVFVKSALLPNQNVKISGFWNDSGFTDNEINGLRRVGGSFEDVLKEPDCDFIFLCHSPQVQFKLIRSLYLHRNTANSNKISKPPVVVLIPPVSPCYDLDTLLYCGPPVRIAMPLRKLFPVSLLANHLKQSCVEKPLDSVRNASSLPPHWSLGVPRSFHARLSVTSSVKPGSYSWLCEPGVMGGGLINLYGAGLIDLAFILTGGLKLTSVNCVSRVFDWKLTGDPSCIRRTSAEDYVVITGELEPNECDAYFGAGASVAVFCLSSELPPLNSIDGSDPLEDFRLNIELVGSSGRFVISEQGNQISWTPIKPLYSRAGTTEMLNNATTVSENESLSLAVKNKSVNGLQNGDSNSFVNQFSLVNGSGNANQCDSDNVWPSTHSNPLVSITAVSHNTEVATLSTKTFNLDSESKTDSNPAHPHPLRLAWSHWLSHLASCVQPDRTKLNMDTLLATPEHWIYVQQVLTALEKSARLRSWVDVVTGERV
ncbi:hypothetical protein D915_010690 [Fasciola hepatica]|uniref:Uncharacterized protein n=1 Tax=Fasciola hepatica TaxID=6192 RepID=A0A4E0QUN1_FASHE|nr:hypothetical protein D915_010690 [Fasciola hepatica]